MPEALARVRTWHEAAHPGVRYSVATEGKADMVAQRRNDANDPKRKYSPFRACCHGPHIERLKGAFDTLKRSN
jgi:hypothetical protein